MIVYGSPIVSNWHRRMKLPYLIESGYLALTLFVGFAVAGFVIGVLTGA